MPAEQPNLSDLMAAYLSRRLHAQGAGSAMAAEVEPHDAVPAQVLNSEQTWSEATAVFAGLDAKIAPPGGWSELIAATEPAIAVPFAAGHFPQSVRDLQRLTRAVESGQCSTLTAASGSAALIESWNKESQRAADLPHRLLAAGLLRVTGQFELAERLLREAKSANDNKSSALVGNECAALLWARSQRTEALDMWKSLPDQPAILFNRGMAALFLGQKLLAKTALSKAVASIPESSGWQHLGRLYLALC